MKLKIREQTEEDTIEFWLEMSNGHLLVMSKRKDAVLTEFTICSDGTWLKTPGGHLQYTEG